MQLFFDMSGDNLSELLYNNINVKKQYEGRISWTLEIYQNKDPKQIVSPGFLQEIVLSLSRQGKTARQIQKLISNSPCHSRNFKQKSTLLGDHEGGAWEF